MAQIFVAIMCAGWMLTPAQAAGPDPSGLWFTKGNGSIIKIAPCGSFYCGALIWLREPNDSNGQPKTDRLNEDESKRGRPLLGINILINLAAEKDHWRGKAYNPEDGKTYDITMKVLDDKAELQGCILKILCQTNLLTRTASVPNAAAPSH